MSCRALLLCVALIGTPALAGTRQQATVIMSENPQGRQSQDDWGYADAVVSGDMIYLSGIVTGQRQGETLEAAYTRTFDGIANILSRAGASWDDVLEMTSYHTDLQSQMPAIVAVKKRYVKPPALAWTAIEISRLIPDRGITEIKVTARKGVERPVQR